MDRASYVNVEPNIHGEAQHTKYTYYFYIVIASIAILLLILVFYYVTKKKEVPVVLPPPQMQQFYRGPPMQPPAPMPAPAPKKAEEPTILETENAPLELNLDDPESTHKVVYTPSLEEIDETKESVYKEATRDDFSFDEDN